jgi:UDPglucose 6-dehydrogenase
MNIVVLGMWHLGCVTAACAAKFESVTGLDLDPLVIRQLRQGKPPLFEPGLTELIDAGLQSGRLKFSDDPASACAEADLLWVCYDTPVDENDHPDLTPVFDGVRRCAAFLPPESLVLVSSQVPVGTCAELQKAHPRFRFGYSPENLRLGKAIEIFLQSDRMILGVRTDQDAVAFAPLLNHFTNNLVVVGVESAEMIKHAINAFLASSITFMNEIARICERVGADAKEVERGLKSESRIGPGAYLSPGGPFAGGTLARDVVVLTEIARQKKEPLALIPAIKVSNDQHKRWAIQVLKAELGSLSGKLIAVLGVTYKPGTDTLRRSLAIELCRSLLDEGAQVRAYDPVVEALPEELSEVTLSGDLNSVVERAAAMVICTEWPQIRAADWEKLCRNNKLFIVDANGFLSATLKRCDGLTYRQVGKPGPETKLSV